MVTQEAEYIIGWAYNIPKLKFALLSIGEGGPNKTTYNYYNYKLTVSTVLPLPVAWTITHFRAYATSTIETEAS